MITKELMQRVNEINMNNGFDVRTYTDKEVLMLINTELCEAVEADRKSNNCTYGLHRFEIFLELHDNPKLSIGVEKELFEIYVKDTVEDELADAAIRCMDYLYHKDYEFIDDFSDDISYISFIKTESFCDNLYDITSNLFQNDLDTFEKIDNTLYDIAVYCKFKNIDLLEHINLKLAYNKTRSYKHDKKY